MLEDVTRAGTDVRVPGLVHASVKLAVENALHHGNEPAQAPLVSVPAIWFARFGSTVHVCIAHATSLLTTPQISLL